MSPLPHSKPVTVPRGLSILSSLLLVTCAANPPLRSAAPTTGDIGGGPTSSGLIQEVPWPEGIRVGNAELGDGLTGCTVVLTDGGAVGGVDVRGGAPGTVETDLLDPVNMVGHLDAVVLAGGSAYGLSARDGVMRYLEEQGQGFAVGSQVVPIVSGAILFDLAVAPAGVRPGADCGYRAAETARPGIPMVGSIGAGAGATVGKLRGMGSAMRGGLGAASIRLDNGLVVAAVVVVNAVGDVVDPATGSVVAGVRGTDGRLLDARRLIRGDIPGDAPGGNTTIGVVVTNAALDKAGTTKVAQMAQDGLARTVFPSHTPSDGDTMFALSTGYLDSQVSVGQVGALAAEVVAQAILVGVLSATGLPDFPAARGSR